MQVLTVMVIAISLTLPSVCYMVYKNVNQAATRGEEGAGAGIGVGRRERGRSPAAGLAVAGARGDEPAGRRRGPASGEEGVGGGGGGSRGGGGRGGAG